MITQPMDVLTHYEVRKTKKQKTAFITAVSAYAASLRYPCTVEKGSLGSRNIILGDPTKAKYLITAHYDTCAWMPFPNFITPTNFLVYLLFQLLLTAVIFAVAIGGGVVLGLGVGTFTQNSELGAVTAGVLAWLLLVGCLLLMMCGPANRHTANDNTSGVVTVLEIAASMPENLRDRVCFVLFDLEEMGLIGSASYRRAHKTQTNSQTVLNLDCVGDGDHILFFPSKKVKVDKTMMARLRLVNGRMKTKSLLIHEKGMAFYPSDQASFPYGVGIAAFRKAKLLGLYCSRIHTHRDTILEQTNVNILRAAIISIIGSADK